LLTHGFLFPDELTRVKAMAANAPASVHDVEMPIPRSQTPTHQPVEESAFEAKLAAAVTEIDGLKSRVSALESAIGDLRKQFGINE